MAKARTATAKLDLTAEDVKAALRRRHPAFEPGYMGVGRWTCIEEWQNVDLLALDSWQAGEVIGYEVKVSRSDMRSELLDPSKRAAAVAMCTRFYFAVPAGMLTDEERAYEEPDWEPGDFEREECTNPDCNAKHERRGWTKSLPKPRGPRLRGTDKEGVSVHLGYGVDRGTCPDGSTYTRHYEISACCAICKGYGKLGKSRVEREAPQLWIPRDVGLVAVNKSSCTVIRQAPRNDHPEPFIPWPFIGYRRADGTVKRRQMPEHELARMERQQLSVFARWVSYRPDPRHRGSSTEDISDAADVPPRHATILF